MSNERLVVVRVPAGYAIRELSFYSDSEVDSFKYFRLQADEWGIEQGMRFEYLCVSRYKDGAWRGGTEESQNQHDKYQIKTLRQDYLFKTLAEAKDTKEIIEDVLSDTGSTWFGGGVVLEDEG
jgi:hypothetical protein